jgi:hypothetical protein
MKNTGLPRVGWRKSTYSFSNGNCVEVAGTGTMIAVRDSQDQGGPQLAFAPEPWAAFAAAVKATPTVSHRCGWLRDQARRSHDQASQATAPRDASRGGA